MSPPKEKAARRRTAKKLKLIKTSVTHPVDKVICQIHPSRGGGDEL